MNYELKKMQYMNIYSYNILPKKIARPSFVSSTPTHNLELMKIVGGHGNSSQTGQVIFGSIDHN
jgi:hypothetical protein